MKLGGNFFEDLYSGQTLINPVPRTLTEGDTALYIALTGGLQQGAGTTPA